MRTFVAISLAALAGVLFAAAPATAKDSKGKYKTVEAKHFDRAEGVELTELELAPAHLKAKVYSALMLKQAETGPLLSLTETRACGHELCVFEDLVRIAPVGEGAKSLNICRVCHARARRQR